jgi:hypothetical protein
MKRIGELEREHSEPHDSSFYPYDMPSKDDEENDGSYYTCYMPCHYFGKVKILPIFCASNLFVDYIAGAGTGG